MNKTIRPFIGEFPKLLACLLLLPVAASAQVIFNDTFSSGTAAGNGYYLIGSNSSLTTNNTLSFLEFRGLSANGTTGSNSFYKQFSSTTLAVGEQLVLSFTIIDFANVGSNAAQGLRIGLFNMPSSTGDQGHPNPNWASGTRNGYWLGVGIGTGTSATYFTGNGTAAATPLNTSTTVGTGNATANLANGAQTTNGTFIISRTSATDVELSGTFGTFPLAAVNTGANDWITFNTLNIGFQNQQVGRFIHFDTISLSVIPEPASVLLLAAAGAGFILLRRRQRRSELDDVSKSPRAGPMDFGPPGGR